MIKEFFFFAVLLACFLVNTVFAQDTTYFDSGNNKVPKGSLYNEIRIKEYLKADSSEYVLKHFSSSMKIKYIDECYLNYENECYKGKLSNFYDNGNFYFEELYDKKINSKSIKRKVLWENGKLKRRELLQKDSVVFQECYDSLGVKIVCDDFEKSAKFVGDVDSMIHFILKKLNYPAMARENNIQGKVLIKFVIEKDGSISNTKIVNSVHPLLDAEALRVVLAMPTWIPAERDGKKIRCWFRLPVKFTLEDPEGLIKKKK